MVAMREPHNSTILFCIADKGIVVSSKRTEKRVFTVIGEDLITFRCSMRRENAIQELEYSEVPTVLSEVAEKVLSLFVKVKELRAERIQDNAPMNHSPPPVLSHQVFSMRLREPFSIIETQKNLLLSS